MSPQEAAEEMRDIFDNTDIESRHLDADALMMRILAEQGFGEAAQIFDKAQKWYA